MLCQTVIGLIISLLQISQLEADLLELGSLLEKSERKRVQELLKQEQKKVEKELSVKRQQKQQQARREADQSTASKAAYTVKITNYGTVLSNTKLFDKKSKQFLIAKKYVFWSYFCYWIFCAAWDQSEKFVKIYLTLKDVHKIPSENVEVKFTER